MSFVENLQFTKNTWEVSLLQQNKLGGHFAFILIFPYKLFEGSEPIFSGINLLYDNILTSEFFFISPVLNKLWIQFTIIATVYVH